MAAIACDVGNIVTVFCNQNDRFLQHWCFLMLPRADMTVPDVYGFMEHSGNAAYLTVTHFWYLCYTGYTYNCLRVCLHDGASRSIALDKYG